MEGGAKVAPEVGGRPGGRRWERWGFGEREELWQLSPGEGLWKTTYDLRDVRELL